MTSRSTPRAGGLLLQPAGRADEPEQAPAERAA